MLHVSVYGEYYIDKSQSLGLSYAVSNPGFAPLVTRSSHALYKILFGRSFYLSGGLGFVEQEKESRIPGPGGDWIIKDRSSTARFALGNVWVYESGFFLAAEWLGVAIPLARLGEPTVTASTPQSQEAISQKREDVRTGPKPYEVSVVKFSLGWHF